MRDRASDPIGTGRCGGCGTETAVYQTAVGIRCDDCQPEYPPDRDTYAPSFQVTPNDDDTTAEADSDLFEDIPEIGIDVEMEDGSTWEMNKLDTLATLMKYGDDWQAFAAALPSEVTTHYEQRTEPTKYGGTTEWGGTEHDDSKTSYQTHTELAPVVAYPALRAPKMQLGFIALADDDEDPVAVIGLGDDEVDYYGTHGRVTVSTDQPVPDDFEFDDGGGA